MCLCLGSLACHYYYVVLDFVIPLPLPWPAWVDPNQSSVQSCSCTYLLTQLNKMLSIIGQRYPVNKVVVGEVLRGWTSLFDIRAVLQTHIYQTVKFLIYSLPSMCSQATKS